MNLTQNEESLAVQKSPQKHQARNMLAALDSDLHSPCWVLDIKFKEYSRSIQGVFKH